MCDTQISFRRSTETKALSIQKKFKTSCLLQQTHIIWTASSEFGTYRLCEQIRAVSPEPPLLAHTSSESRGTFRQKARSLAPLNGWACAVKICDDGMLEDTNSLDGAHMKYIVVLVFICLNIGTKWSTSSQLKLRR